MQRQVCMWAFEPIDGTLGLLNKTYWINVEALLFISWNVLIFMCGSNALGCILVMHELPIAVLVLLVACILHLLTYGQHTTCFWACESGYKKYMQGYAAEFKDGLQRSSEAILSARQTSVLPFSDALKQFLTLFAPEHQSTFEPCWSWDFQSKKALHPQNPLPLLTVCPASFFCIFHEVSGYREPSNIVTEKSVWFSTKSIVWWSARKRFECMSLIRRNKKAGTKVEDIGLV